MKFTKNSLLVVVFIFLLISIGLTSCMPSSDDTAPPKIIITSNFKNNSETTENSITITGKVTDNKTKQPTLNINGKIISLDANNEFSYTTNLHSGINSIILVAKDEKGNTQRKVLSITKTTPPPPPPPPPTPVHIGDDVILGENALVASTKSDLEECARLAVAGDTVGITEMILNGQAFIIGEETKALVIDVDFDWNIGASIARVRIMSGDQFGRSGWTLEKFCKKPK